jgi:molecular chaperone Hsp33
MKSNTNLTGTASGTKDKKGDRWIRCIANGGNFIATAISGTHLVREARKRHAETMHSALETKCLGETLIAGLLLASTCKKGERVSLSVRGQKLLRQCVVDANPDGTVRGFILTRDSVLQSDESGGPWQDGMLSVARLKLNENEPYVGTVPAVTGHLAKDLTFYLSQSEQIPSAVGLAVSMDGSKVEAAGGFLVQVLPGASLEEIKSIENNIQGMESIAEQVARNPDPTHLLGQIFSDVTFSLLEEKSLSFNCNCSRERVTRALKLLGSAEISTMQKEDKGADITCDFCGNHFNFSEDQLGALCAEIDQELSKA